MRPWRIPTPEEFVNDDLLRPEIFRHEFSFVRFPNAKPEAFKTVMLPLQFLEFDDFDANGSNVRLDHFRISVNIDVSDVVVRREVGAFPRHSTIGHLFSY